MNKITGSNVLVVEDDPIIRDSILDLLEISGFNVTIAENGHVALELIDTMLPDLILCDIKMPKLDGYTFLKKLRSRKDSELIPVVFITGLVDFDSRMKGLELGVDDFLTKPFEFRELSLKVRNLLSTRQKLKERYFLGDINPDELTTSDLDFMKKVNLILEAEVSNRNLGIDELCDHLGVSPSTFQRKIKRMTGKTPVQLINAFKLNRARKMIRSNYGSISEIAYKTGFSNPAYFSTVYKSYFGMTPTKELDLAVGHLS